MKQNDLIVLALAGVAVWLIVQAKKTTTKTSSTGAASSFTNEIFDAGGGQFGNGWRYFSDGTAIDPSGSYYYGGQRVYTAPVQA